MTNNQTLPQTADPYHVAVDNQDMDFLRSLQTPEEMGKHLRLWPEPYSKRGQALVVPTHMTIMANTPGERAYALHRLEEDRAARLDPATKTSTVERLSKILDMHKSGPSDLQQQAA